MGVWKVPLAPAMRMMRGDTFQPLLSSSVSRGMVFCCILSREKRSLVYVNLMNCIFMLGFYWRDGWPL